ncbi:MAG: hypothetical protein MUF09_08700 [Candidatus Nanopelagicales bacterium]|nr:hypothetical protein [Candidatus Nanopelagicales bacterium]
MQKDLLQRVGRGLVEGSAAGIDALQRRLRGRRAILQFWARAGVLLAVLVPVALLAGWLGGLASTSSGPSIVQVEVAGSPKAFDELVAEAGAAGVSLTVPLWWDFLFIAFYAAALGLACRVFGVAGYRISAMFGAAGRVALLAAGAAALDVVENVLLLWRLYNPDAPGWAVAVAAACAWAKFALLAVVLGYLAGALAGFLVRPAWMPPTAVLGQTRSDRQAPAPVVASGDVPAAAGSRPYALAISGGGVRSASFALGALQKLDRSDSIFAWDQLRRVTAISGGSYMAAAWLVSRPPPDSKASETAQEKWDKSTRSGQERTGSGAVSVGPRPWLRQDDQPGPEERHLRANLGYLLEPAPSAQEQNADSVSAATPVPVAPPRGPVGAVGTLLAGLVCNLVALTVVLAAVALPLGWLVGSDLIDPRIGAGQLDADGWDRLRLPVLVWACVTVVAFALWMFGRRLLSAGSRSAEGEGSAPSGSPGAASGWWSSLGAIGRVAELCGWVATRAALVLTATLAVLLLLIPWALETLPALRGPGATARWVQAALAAGLLGTLASLVKSVAKVGVVKQWMPRLGGLLLAAVVLLIGGWLVYGAAAGSIPPGREVAVAALLALLAYGVVNPEWWALAPFYRGRLRSAYALHRVRSGPSGGGAVVARAYNGQDEPLLSDYRVGSAERAQPAAGPVGPDLTICTAANVSDKSEQTVYGIPAWSLTMSPSSVVLHRPLIGRPGPDVGQTGYACDPRTIEDLWRHVDNPRYTVMAAVGMSGAAISPGLGRFTKGSTDSLLALANVRLGVWLPNPKHASAFAAAKAATPSGGSLPPVYPRVRLGYLLKELLGLFDPDDLYLYVTDGGHWDNSGVVEQLRDGAVTELVCLDGSGAPAGGMGTLSDAMTLAKEETGAEIRVDFRPLRLVKDDTTSPRAITLGVIDYRRAANAVHPLGLLWYGRPAITPTVRPLIAAFREQHATFPNDSTLNQFFSDLRFEAYRQLGEDTAADLLDARRRLLNAFTTCPTLHELRQHAETTEPPSDWTVSAFLAALPQLREDDLQDCYQSLRSSMGIGPGPNQAEADHADLDSPASCRPAVGTGLPRL